MKFTGLLFILFLLFGIQSYSQSIVINEFMSSNNSFLQGMDGEYYDWIEIYNNGDSTVNLNRYYLSDDTSEILKWQFPDVSLEPDSFLVVFASGTENNQHVRHWETIIDWGDTWRYYGGQSAPGADWNTKEFNDASWQQGPSGFGYSDNDDATVVQPSAALYIRRSFNIEDTSQVSEVLFHADYDDGFVAYINGKEIARANIGTPGIPPQHNDFASSAREAEIYTGGFPEKFVVDNWKSVLVEGENVIAVQVHNVSSSSSDMTIIPFLTLGLSEVPANPKGSPEILNLTLPGIHSNFKLDADGEYIVLSDSSGIIIDSIYSGVMYSDISKGRYPDGTGEWFYFDEPTPGYNNSESPVIDIEQPPQFSVQAGFYPSSINLALTTNSPAGNIYYTTDGSQPDENSIPYSGPVAINSTTVIKARVISGNSLPSSIITHTYFINESFNIPVISLSTEPANFWDEDTGIYVKGKNAESSFPYFGANFWQDWERPVHLEFFEPGGTEGFSIAAGVKIYGGWSRGHAQKSLAIYFRSIYGYGDLDYEVFPGLPVDEFEAIVLRNSGNDWDYSMIRDALMTTLAAEVDVDVQAYRPGVLFINGEYWGIHNIREKINEHLIASHYNLDPDSINILENQSSTIQGSNREYLELLDFMNTHSLSSENNYDYVRNRIDIDDFMNYWLCEIYYNNTDWPGNNIKYWSSVKPGSKWRWIMYDTDFGFGLYGSNEYQENTLDFATELNGPSWPNPPWSTFLLRKLLENDEFKINFINRYADLINSIFKPENVINKIDEMANLIKPEMPAHKSKWGQSYSGWLNNIDYLSVFAVNRPVYLTGNFNRKFNLKGTDSFEVNADTGRGFIRVNSLLIKELPWTGSYFKEVPVELTAVPKRGYKFSYWAGGVQQEGRTISVLPEVINNIIAYFEPDTGQSSEIVINEINYNSSPEYNSEDWIELYNNSSSIVDISGWMLKDENVEHSFVIKDGTKIQPGGFLVLCRDTAMFNSIYPDCENYIGNLSFGFDGSGESVCLLDNSLSLVDSLLYKDESPWPIEPDGTGHTLSLIDPELDNSKPESWKASLELGTPGMVNDVFVSVNDNKENLPHKFKLEQNYPNPFNPVTKIKYSIPAVETRHASSLQMVTLKVYDILGREVTTLVNEEKQPGNYEITFNASGLSSGIYYYRLKSGGFVETKKLVLLK